ncbi:AraC family transcriptional regulator [Paenibacillus dakarensis]|uniref:AraC family transcriptional regulator n=1 Tax=Paenibacillus dakarensis TaxID=1527293 RepID=UPI0006D563FA|nr:AraC family transcriptional regulator [Paenibacillus dakarensis]
MEIFNTTFSALQGQIDLSLLFFGMEKCEPGHNWGPGLRNTYILHYIHSGRGVFRTKESVYELEAGQGFVIMPDTLVHYTADETDPWVYSWVGFKGVNVKPLLQQAHIDMKRPIFTVYPAHSLDYFFEELESTFGTRGSDVRGLSILYRIMADIISSSPEIHPGRKTTHSHEDYIQKSIQYIESSYSQKITVLDIARFIGLDRSYLSGLFKERFGLSLQAFLLEYRMSRASELLQNPELSVSDVSRSVGYTDPFLFSKMFKKTVGMAPNVFRSKL